MISADLLPWHVTESRGAHLATGRPCTAEFQGCGAADEDDASFVEYNYGFHDAHVVLVGISFSISSCAVFASTLIVAPFGHHQTLVSCVTTQFPTLVVNMHPCFQHSLCLISQFIVGGVFSCWKSCQLSCTV